MLGKRSAALVRIFYSLYALCFGWVLFCCVFANTIYAYEAPLSLLLMMAGSALFFIIYRQLVKNQQVFSKWSAVICAGVVVFTGAFQLVNGFAMRYDPAYDLWAVYGGGMAWAENGTLVNDEYFMAYFHMFPANLGGAYLFRCIFGVGKLLGIKDHYAMALVFNVIFLQTSLVLCHVILCKTAGKPAGVLGLAAFLLFPPFYMMGPVFYTDLLSVLPPIAILALFIAGRKQKSPAKKAGLYALMGTVAAMGAVVKFTVTIALIAAVIATLVAPSHVAKKDYKRRVLLPVLVSVLAFFLIMGGWQRVKNGTLDSARLEKESMPFSHWVAMGLIGEGGYDEADYDRAMKLPSRAAREETNKELIGVRLTQPSLLDLAKLFTRKAIRCFGDGTYDLAIFLDDGPHQRAFVHELVLFDGKYHTLYRNLSQGMYLGLFFLSLVPPVQASLSAGRGCRALRTPAPWLNMFGLLLFLMMWETNSRYTLNYMPILVVCAGLGTAWLRFPQSRKKVRIPKNDIVKIKQ